MYIFGWMVTYIFGWMSRYIYIWVCTYRQYVDCLWGSGSPHLPPLGSGQWGRDWQIPPGTYLTLIPCEQRQHLSTADPPLGHSHPGTRCPQYNQARHRRPQLTQETLVNPHTAHLVSGQCLIAAEPHPPRGLSPSPGYFLVSLAPLHFLYRPWAATRILHPGPSTATHPPQCI